MLLIVAKRVCHEIYGYNWTFSQSLMIELAGPAVT